MLQNIPKEKVLAIVKQGPTFPAKVAKQLIVGGDTVLIGAILSTLVSTGEVKVSTLKIGGTPLYYVPEHESKLEEFIDHLNDKDRKTFRLLKDSKVLQDSAQDPLIRFSLRTIKDFAKPFEVSSQGQKVLFWRFYDIDLNDAESLAKNMLRQAQKSSVQPAPIQSVPVQSIPVREAQPSAKSDAAHHELKPSLMIEPKIVEPKITESKPIEQNIVSVSQPVIHQAMPQEAQQILEEAGNAERAKETERQDHAHVKEPKEHKRVKHEHQEKPKRALKAEDKAVEKDKTDKAKHVKPEKIPYDFLELLRNHFASRGLDMISKEKIKKTEYDLILKNHDNNEYIYCKAKDKSSISEGDLAPALIFAQSKKMPCLFISTGELTKKAESMLGKELSALKFERITANKVVNQ